MFSGCTSLSHVILRTNDVFNFRDTRDMFKGTNDLTVHFISESKAQADVFNKCTNGYMMFASG
jgi:hypothetical protein